VQAYTTPAPVPKPAAASKVKKAKEKLTPMERMKRRTQKLLNSTVKQDQAKAKSKKAELQAFVRERHALQKQANEYRPPRDNLSPPIQRCGVMHSPPLQLCACLGGHSTPASAPL